MVAGTEQPSEILELKIVGRDLTYESRSQLVNGLGEQSVFQEVLRPLKTDVSVAADAIVLVCSLICAAAVLPDAIKNVQNVIGGMDKKGMELWIEFQGMRIRLDRKMEEIVKTIRAILRRDEDRNDG